VKSYRSGRGRREKTMRRRVQKTYREPYKYIMRRRTKGSSPKPGEKKKKNLPPYRKRGHKRRRHRGPGVTRRENLNIGGSSPQHMKYLPYHSPMIKEKEKREMLLYIKKRKKKQLPGPKGRGIFSARGKGRRNV